MPVLSEGCVLCMKGAKMVLFVTGLCRRTCWYCPVSAERRGKDGSYANDRPVYSVQDIAAEADMMSALGTGITGGEPLLVLDRVVEYAGFLKDRYGAGHHIHLYTGCAPTMEQLERIQGLVDEIRLHPPHECWHGIMESPYLASIQAARRMGFSIGIEVPSLPGLEEFIPVLPFIDFLNINELEWSETNAAGMRRKGYSLADNCHNAVRDAKKYARKLLSNPKVHWCSSSFKDSVQLRERLKRIAQNTARPFDEITDDGTIIYGILEPSGPVPAVDPTLMEERDGHIEMSWRLLVEEAGCLEGKKYVVERYPNRGMVVEVLPL